MIRPWQWLVLGMTLLPGPVAADLPDEMKGLFEAMVNVTEPTAYQGQRRGG